MCGIAGVLSFDGATVAPDLLRRMIGLVKHRGPDSSGVYTSDTSGVGLAHARLSIIDLTGGKQPMSNEDGSLWITFNGEIFNYLELRDNLLQAGHRFRTQSDTEVILHMYQEKGEDCVRYFNGQWAFAIWDAKGRKLFLSRDRVGVRPLFYTRTAKNFLFASEIKSLLIHPEVERAIDLEALDQIFTYWCTLPPTTMFKGIHELPPGHSMAVEEGKLRLWQYWRLDYSSVDARMGAEDCAGRLLDLLSDATRLRLRSDVPVGAYLSGGLDSSFITALTQRYSGDRLKTFSVTFEDPEFDESSYQSDVIGLLGTDHNSIRCSYQDICDVFPDVIWHAEKPILRTAPAPLYLLSRLVRHDGYKVVLTGEGSDEFLGGYDVFKEAKIRRFWAVDLASRHRPLLLKRLYPYLSNLQAQSDAYLKAFFHVNPMDLSNPFFSHLPRWELTGKLKVFLSAAVKHEIGAANGYRQMKKILPDAFTQWDGLSQAQYLEATGLLPGYILSSQGDRMAMANSVEGRYPFLDHRVVEFACKIPPRLRMKALNEKYILKQAAGRLVPASVQRRSKQPYRAPDSRSFFDPAAQRARSDYVDQLLSGDSIRNGGLFNPQAVQKLADKARRGEVVGAKDNMALVGILSTQLFMDQFINRLGRHA
ncbi:MAG TPA: asparagine synthase (glutamine-hydrolyzing) [Candidatus Binatia bacterium]